MLERDELDVVGATAWAWASGKVSGDGPIVDVLFVDEAGQMSLANALAAAPAARAMVLLGDPQQLDQPTQGSHPPGAERSALGHILRDRSTIEPSEGLFLEQTWRLHPEICDYTSTAFYAGRLETVEGLGRQVVDGPPDHRLTGSGVRYIPVEHHDNATESSEEAEAIVTLVSSLVDGGSTWTDRHGQPHPITLDDIVIVAPYNAHVAEIARAFAATGRPGAFIGTVDKFQGQERPISIYAMGTSAPGGCPPGHGVPVLAQPAQRGHVASPLRDGRGLLPRPAAGRLQDASPDAAGERPVPGRRGRRRRRERGQDPAPDHLTYRGGRMTAAALTPADLDHARRRSRSALFAGVALGSTGHIAAVTVATIVARDLLGSQALAGAPGATVVLGAALGAILLSALMARSGRRIGLVAGYSVGVIGALVATAAVITRSFPLLLLGTLLIGFGNASNQLSRYTAADMVPPERRASAIGLVVWAATIGSVVGPWLVPIASDMAAAVGLPPLAGPYLVPVVFVGLAAILSFVMLRPDPYDLADESSRADPGAEPAVLGPVRDILRRPAVAAAIVALVVSQFVMVLIMTMTPLHMVEHGHDLGAVGLVLSAHTLGMFAFSPLSGWLSDRFGRVPTIFLGTAVLGVASLMAAFAPPDGGLVLVTGPVPARARVELRVRRRQRDALREPRDPRAHPGPGRRGRADLELRRGRGPGLRADHGRRGLHGPRNPRRGRGHHPRDRPALAPRGDGTRDGRGPSRRGGRGRAAPLTDQPDGPVSAAPNSSATQAASTRAQASTSTRGTRSSAPWARRTSPGP